jgi:hypothetical protein
MEGLLILIGIWVLDVVIKKVVANRAKQRQLPPQSEPVDSDEVEAPDYDESEARPPRSLQDLIRQFEEAQRQATQGNIEPPTPPVERDYDPNTVTLREVAKVITSVDVVDAEFLVDTFGFTHEQALTVIAELQKHRIIGREMDGQCDVLVHDLDELENLFIREQRAEEERQRQEAQAEEERLAEQQRLVERQQHQQRQRELNALEERAKAARESAAFTGAGFSNNADNGEIAQTVRKPAVSAKNIADVRRGFIWAKVLDEPRFKCRWSAIRR